jgi:hypothetical protein
MSMRKGRIGASARSALVIEVLPLPVRWRAMEQFDSMLS